MSTLYQHRAPHEGYQRILNAHPVPPRDRQVDPPEPIPIRARVVWERDGAQVIETRANAWCGSLVLVEVLDTRSRLRGVWLEAVDVERL